MPRGDVRHHRPVAAGFAQVVGQEPVTSRDLRRRPVDPKDCANGAPSQCSAIHAVAWIGQIGVVHYQHNFLALAQQPVDDLVQPALEWSRFAVGTRGHKSRVREILCREREHDRIERMILLQRSTNALIEASAEVARLAQWRNPAAKNGGHPQRPTKLQRRPGWEANTIP